VVHQLTVIGEAVAHLSEGLRGLDRYTAAYPRQPDGHVLFPFTRLFFVAYR
jgi:trans-aconitate methyltransferase